MAAPDKLMSPADIRVSAQRWYESQRAISAKCLGTLWPEHREWVESYLKTELKARLIALGWRAASANE